MLHILPVRASRRILPCLKVSALFCIWVPQCKLDSLLSWCLPFLWRHSWFFFGGPRKASNTSRWIYSVRPSYAFRCSLTTEYPAVFIVWDIIFGFIWRIEPKLPFAMQPRLRTRPKLLTWYLPRYPGTGFQISTLKIVAGAA